MPRRSPLHLLAGPLVVAALVGVALAYRAAHRVDAFGTPLVFRTGEVYLYGHRIEPPYKLSVVDSVLMLNDIPISPTLSPPCPALSPDQKEAERRQYALSTQIFARERDLVARGVPQGEATRAIVEFVSADTATVAAVTSIAEDKGEFMVRWKDGTHEGFDLVVPPGTLPPPSRREIIAANVEKWRDLLRNGALIAFAWNWEGTTTDDSQKPRVREEIQRARETPVEVFDRTYRVCDAEARLAKGRLPDSLRYLVGQPTWRSEVFRRVDNARLFREPLPLPIGKTGR